MVRIQTLLELLPIAPEEIFQVLSLSPQQATEIDDFFPNAHTILPHPEQLEFFTTGSYPQQPLPFADRSFDVICAVDCFHTFVRPSEALWEILRLLRYGGVYLIAGEKTALERLGNRFFLPFRECEMVAEQVHDGYRVLVVRWRQPQRRIFEPGTFLWPTLLPKGQERAQIQRVDTAKTPYFFFYGSLMARYSNFRRYLREQVVTVEPAFCAGILYALPMGYPGMVQCEKGAGTMISGEVMTFHDPYRTMRVLDRLEECVAEDPGRGMYRRVLQPVKVLSVDMEGNALFSRRLAWVYFFPEHNLRTVCQGQACELPCGSWKAYRTPPEGEWRREEMHLAADYDLVSPYLHHNFTWETLPCRRRCQSQVSCPWSPR
ncbi:gamma-glutamylcyclotransferase [Chrysiogenes arsenatis]|uniref:gamma-glutamylcyclotransferase n=1 Tax=Chrysiogenes arsenatis TaxID=309797 RepID=UPI0012697485|nr:gamma-glutamylcyclotransferase [Chrysiogenes arsenatis]